MKQHLALLRSVRLFEGIDGDAIMSVLGCIGADPRGVKKGDIVLLAGDKPDYVGILLSGRLHIIREDEGGNRAVVTAIAPGGIFAEALCCADVARSPVTVIADADSVILPLRFERILHVCSHACAFHSKLIENMLFILAQKNLLLQSRMEIVCLKSVRAKVMRYLESFVPQQGREFAIPFNREALADFLCVERSALSHELARMKRDGLIDYHKNHFCMK